MSLVDVLVVADAVALVVVPAWFFFGPRTVRFAELRGGVQQVE